jgi:hypothetical protein
MEPYMNVAESYPLYDTVIVCEELYGKEKAINGWFTSFVDFAANEKHTFFKSRTIGNSHLAYCNMDSADNVDFVYKAISLGVRFFAPIMPDSDFSVIVSPSMYNENAHAFWMFDLAKHVGLDFRVQQDVIVENTALATPPGYGPRGGGGVVSYFDTTTAPAPMQDPWKVVTGSNGEPVIDNRFPFPKPIQIPRNTPIECNLYLSTYAKAVIGNWIGPRSWYLPAEASDTEGGEATDFISLKTRWGIQVSLYGFREVQQRGQYHAPGAIAPSQ